MSTDLHEDHPRIGHNRPPASLDEIVETLPLDLRERHGELAAAIAAIAARANEFHPQGAGRKIEGPADVEIAKKVILDANAAAKQVDVAFRREKKPWLDGSRTVDGHFRAYDHRLDRIAGYLDGLIRGYQDKIEQAEQLRLREEARKRREEEDRQREIARKAEEAGRHAAAAKAAQKADNAAVAAEQARAAQEKASETRTAGDAFAGMSVATSWTFEIVDRSAIDLNKLAPWIPLAEIEKALRGYVKANKGTAPLAGVRIFETSSNRYRA